VIPYGKQDIINSDINAVVNVLKSEYLTQGPVIEKFEEKLSSYCGSNFAIAVNSATSALHISCLALGVGKGDIVWTSPNSFVASGNCALYCGAEVDFVDISLKTYNISISKLKEKLEKAKKINKLPKVVIPVHYAGQSCDMKEIYQLSINYGFRIIEDASHAIGSSYRNQKVGSCKYSDITVFSFHPVKIITTGEGGLATTNNQDLARQLKLLRTHGITRDHLAMHDKPEGDWFYEQSTLGFNYRMTDFQAALGISQLERIDSFVKKRQALRDWYTSKLSKLPIICPYQSENCYSAVHLYPILISKSCKKNRKELFDELRKKGILVNVHYRPIHTQFFYKKLGFSEGQFPNSEYFYQNEISLPIFPKLEKLQQKKVVDTIRDYIS